MSRVWEAVNKGIKAGPVVVILTRLSKSREQEKKYHAMIGDIAKTVERDGRRFSTDVWKALLIDSYENELINMGEGLTHPSKVVISLDGMRAVTIRASSKKFRKSEASGFIQYLYAFGVENGATFSEQSLAIYEEYKEAKN
jgi:hypothetical protein